MLMHAPIAWRAIMHVPDMTLPATVAAPPVGQILNYTMELFPSSGVRIAASKSPIITLPTDTLSNQLFHGRLKTGLKFERSIVNGDDFGQVSSSFGEFELHNADGYYDAIYLSDTFDGRRVVFKYGWINDAGIPSSYDIYPTLLDGIVEDLFLEDAVLRGILKNNSWKLDVPVCPSIYGGTGGVDGTPDMAGKRKPRAFGGIVPGTGNGGNVTPPLIDPANLVYQVNDGTVSSIPNVYDSGYLLNGPMADYASYAALIALTTIPDGWFATCTALGLFRLGALPSGLITCDVQGDAAPTYVNDTASIVRRALASTAVSLIDEGSFAAVTALQPAVVGYWVDGNETVRQMIDNLCRGIGGWCGERRDGVFEISVLVAPAGTPVASYTNTDIISISRVQLPSGLNPPPKRRRVIWGRNWTVQTEVSGGVSATRAQALKDAFSVAISTNTSLTAAITAAHPLAQDPDPIPGYYAVAADAVAEANRKFLLDAGAVRSLYRVLLKSKAYVHNIGHVILLTYPRWDLTAGKLGVVVGTNDNTTEGTSELLVFV